jgi:hypothetical protein
MMSFEVVVMYVRRGFFGFMSIALGMGMAGSANGSGNGWRRILDGLRTNIAIWDVWTIWCECV